MERAARIIARLKLPPGAVQPWELARAAWPVAVGPKIAAHTEAVWLEANRLVVQVEDPDWRRQLEPLKKQILKRLEEALGSALVADIEWRLKPARRQPQRSATARPAADEADLIADPVLKAIYREQRRRRSA